MDNLLPALTDILPMALRPDYLSAIVGSLAALFAGKIAGLTVASRLQESRTRENLRQIGRAHV